MLDGLLIGVILGLSSAPHCLAMCGPLTVFASVDERRVASPAAALRYQAGRAVGYVVVGAVAGGLGRGVAAIVPFEAEAIFSFALASTLVLAALRAWPRSGLVALSRAPRRSPVGAWLRQRSASSSAAVAALLARLPRKPLVLGMASALLPCGVLASGALLAVGTGAALSGASVMLGLAFGSGIAVAFGSVVLGRADLSASPHASRALSIVLVLGALILASRPFLMGEAGGSCHSG